MLRDRVMRAHLLAPALALLCHLSTPAAILAQGAGHPQSGSSGGERSSSRTAASGHPGAAAAGGGTAPHVSPTTPPSTHPHGHGHRPSAGSAAPNGSVEASPFLATPSTYAPIFVSPLFGDAYSIYATPVVCGNPAECTPPPDDSTVIPPRLDAPLEISSSGDTADIRLDVRPTWAQVFVDNAFVGTVDDYLHVLAGLNVHAGRHRLEFRAPGYETLVTDLDVTAGRIVTYRAELRPRQH